MKFSQQFLLTFCLCLWFSEAGFADSNAVDYQYWLTNVTAAADQERDAVSQNADKTNDLAANFSLGRSSVIEQNTWMETDIGNVVAKGSVLQNGSSFFITGSGSDIGGNNDEFHMVAQPISDDCEIQAQVMSIDNTSGWAKAGIIIRESLATNAMYAGIFVTPNNGVNFQYRTATGVNYGYFNYKSEIPFQWVRLVRTGNTFGGYISPDGINWKLLGHLQQVFMAADASAGFLVTSHERGTLCAADFVNTSLISLPSPWHFKNIGIAGLAGFAIYSSGIFKLSGTGGSLDCATDSLRYVSQLAGDDCSISAKTSGVSDRNAGGQAGVMIRETLNVNSAYVAVVVLPKNAITLQWRPTTGDCVSRSDIIHLKTPCWVCLKRIGNHFIGYSSIEGKTWSLIGQTTVPMGHGCQIGLLTCSHDSGTGCTTFFSDVAVAP